MNKQTIIFEANEQTLTFVSGDQNYASNTVDYVEAVFRLGENWDFDVIVAVWQSKTQKIATVLGDGVCIVPTEVLAETGVVKVNLAGSDIVGDVVEERLTTYPEFALLVDATAQTSGTETQPITPSQFEQFVGIVAEDADRAETAKTEAKGYAEDASEAKEQARGFAEDAEGYKDDASESATQAGEYKDEAKGYAEDAEADAKEIRNMRATANTLPAGSSATANYSDGLLTLGIPKGDKGATGATGNGIASSVLNSDYTLTLNFTDGTHYTTPSIRGAQGIQGETGNGIDRIELTDTTGAVKTYTIYFTDGSTYDFEVTDGEVTDAVLDEATIVQTNSDNVPYLFRPSGGDVRTGRKEFDTIVGGTVAWNQLFSGLATDTRDGITTEYDATTKKIKITNNSRTTNYSSGSSRGDIVSGLTIGHKYLIITQDIVGVLFTQSNTNAPVGKIYQATVDHLILRVSLDYDFVTAHPIGNVTTFDFNMVDLTAYFGSTIADYAYTLESGTAGAGVAWLKENAPQLFEYQEYDAGSLVSVSNLTSHVMRDADDNVIGSYPLDSTLTLRGIPKLVDGKLKYDGDRYNADGIVIRNTILRAYQSGDESLANAITDGTNTVVYSANASTETADPYTNPQIVDPSGTEEYVGSPIPVGHETDYPMTLTDTMPTADGNYTLNLTVANGKRSVSWS